MGWKLTVLALLFAVWALDVGALALGIPILLYIFYKYWAKRSGSPSGRSHKLAYLGAIMILLAVVALAENGTYSPIVFGAAGTTLLVLGLLPVSVQSMVERVMGPASEALRRTKERTPQFVELTVLPLGYLDVKKNDPGVTLQRFERLAQTLAEFDTPIEMRVQFSGGSGRILFSGRNATDGGAGLLRVVRSQLPDFRAELTGAPTMVENVRVLIEGVPEASPDPLGSLAKFFVENNLSGVYSVRVASAWVNPVSRWLAGRRQRKISEGAGYQHVDDDRTTSIVDHPKRVELEHSVKGLERLIARSPVRVQVHVSADDGATASQAASILVGALSSHRKIDGLRVSRPRQGNGWHRSTLMLPAEAAPYLWLPHVSLGMKVSPSAEFQAPPATEGEIILGEAASLSGRSGVQVRVDRDQLTKHVFVTGMTGSGKTTSCFGLLLQLDRLEVPFLVIEPVKAEYRSLMAAIPDLQVFTVGDDTAPFRLNVFEPPPGVKVRAHLGNLASVWNGSFVSYSPVQYVVPEVFAEAYRACGWDLAADRRGRLVTLDDVEAAVQRVVRGLGYESKVTMDVEAAILVRLRSLASGGKGELLGAVASTPLEAVMSKPTVVELKGIRNSDEKAFVAALLMANVAGYVQARGASRSLKHFTLIEEAHRLLPRVSTEKGEPEAADPRRMLVEQFGDMLAELRAYGEGLGVVEQIPTKVLPDAIKNTATKVVHRVPSEDDREAMAGAMNASEEQAAVLTALRPGEAVVSVEGHPVPVRVEVEDAVSGRGIAVGEVSDLDVKKRMRGFYLENPMPVDPPKARDSRIRMLVDSEQFRVEFMRAYRMWLKSGATAPLRDFLLQVASGMAQEREGRVDAAAKILYLATGFYLPFNAQQREKFPRLFRKELEAAPGA